MDDSKQVRMSGTHEMKTRQTREMRTICHKTCYERSAAVRRVSHSTIWKGVEYCRLCDAWHVTRGTILPVVSVLAEPSGGAKGLPIPAAKREGAPRSTVRVIRRRTLAAAGKAI